MSVVTIGAGLGGLLGGWVVERIGRKLTLMFCAMPFIFGFTIMIAAQNHWMLYVGRILTGLASGVTSLVVPLYISEMAHERVRGAVGSCVQLMVVTGIMGAYIAGLFQGWRWLAITCAIPPTVMLMFMCFMPETPRYLLTQGKRREAEEALRFLRGPHAPVEWECDRIEEASREEEGHFSLADLKDPGIYKPLGVGVMMMLLQQFTGINAIMFYAETIFEQAHFKNSDIATVVVAATQVVFTAVAALIMDRAGRKVLLILSGVAMCVSEVVFGIYFKLSTMEHGNSSLLKALSGTHGTVSETPPNDLTWLALASMGVFITGFALGWGPTPWLVMSEIFPMRARGLGSAVCVLTNWTCAFIVTKTFQNLMMMKDITVVETNYTEYGVVLKYKKMDKEYTQVALYGRTPVLRPELIEKFRSFVLSLGFSEESIAVPVIKDGISYNGGYGLDLIARREVRTVKTGSREPSRVYFNPAIVSTQVTIANRY
ncbi:hypothetical protein P4O66_001796 [Electrophorus voltai]|uniref:Solute carrier family 2, facilitated glucose transporter member 8 n=1 Tax=Electrophorus voltai TaxID=2609070 RepID=A0AAD8Z2T5_9TELE|nr:hypothetical protein P4O66_001796 [Electrophorus voltai]